MRAKGTATLSSSIQQFLGHRPKKAKAIFNTGEAE
jgi:hypothetical protein